jgi:chromosome segregation ATPase
MAVMDLERTMQFIVEQQAQFWASVQKHDEQIAALTASVQRHDEQIAALTASVQRHDEQIAHLGEQVTTLTNLVGRLAQAEIHIAEQMQGHEARLESLETKMTQFLDRMDRFIQGFEGDGHKPQ